MDVSERSERTMSTVPTPAKRSEAVPHEGRPADLRAHS